MRAFLHQRFTIRMMYDNWRNVLNEKTRQVWENKVVIVFIGDQIGLIEGDVNDKIFLNLRSSTQFSILNSNKLVSKACNHF